MTGVVIVTHFLRMINAKLTMDVNRIYHVFRKLNKRKQRNHFNDRKAGKRGF